MYVCTCSNEYSVNLCILSSEPSVSINRAQTKPKTHKRCVSLLYFLLSLFFLVVVHPHTNQPRKKKCFLNTTSKDDKEKKKK